MSRDLPRLMIAAPASGSGKTTLAIGLLRVLLDRGQNPAAFKCGPDYIDPMFHREVLGVHGRNLDLFFAEPDLVRGLLLDGAASAGVAVLEGVMGYYDGIADTDAASSWRVAVETGTPTVLALQPRGAFLSLAALVKGFLSFRENSMVRGLVLNRCSESFFAKARPMLERETGLKVFGYLPDLPEAALESRHLGLVTPEGVLSLREKIRTLAARMEETLDIAGLLELARSAPALAGELPAVAPATASRPRIAVARDAAFCFYYRENLDLLERLGAELAFFSPLADTVLPEDIGGLYLGGGYPELHAAALADNPSMLAAIRDAVAGGLPTVAECGGFLYLQEGIEDADGRAHPMVGALSGTSRNAGKLGRFGYVALTAGRDNLLCKTGESIRAHEFHYWDSTRNGEDCLAEKPGASRSWKCGVADETLFAGFPHLYFWSNPDFARRFVAAASVWRGK